MLRGREGKARRIPPLCATLKDYLSNTSIHGIKYITKEGLHWTERFFWLVVCSLSWYYCSLFMAESWKVFQNNPISFVVETDYLRWNTSFPAVSVCEEDNMDNVFKVADVYFGNEHDFNLDEVIKEISYFRENTYYINEFCTDNLQCPQDGLEDIATKVRSPCEAVFEGCDWNGVPFNCCSKFSRIYTEVGTCYTVNSMRESGGPLNSFMISNRNTGPGTLDLKIKVPSRVYLHSPEEVPFLNSPESILTVSSAHITKRFAIREVHNGEDVKEVDATMRRCKFPTETAEDSVYSHYSYSACVVKCRAMHERRECNCTPPLTPGSRPEDSCNMSGLLCLSHALGKLAVLKSEWNELKGGIYCPCYPSCEEIEIDSIEEYATKVDDPIRSVKIILDRLPTERYLRKVVRGKLDLVVALGGTCGLFVGASLLSAVELIYYFSLRVWCLERGSSRKGQTDKGKKNRLKKHAFGLKRCRKRAVYPFTAELMSNEAEAKFTRIIQVDEG